jgi:hypothetical protein
MTVAANENAAQPMWPFYTAGTMPRILEREPIGWRQRIGMIGAWS